MRKHSKKAAKKSAKPAVTVGIDIGDRYRRYCVLQHAELMEEGRMRTEAADTHRHGVWHAFAVDQPLARRAGP